MIINGELSKSQLKELRQALSKLDFPPKKRQRLLWRLAKYGAIDAAKRHVRQQQAPDGKAWAKRQSKWRKKLLHKMPKVLHIREMPEINAVRIYLQGGGYRNGVTPVPAGVVGYSQQNGMHVTINARQVNNVPDAGAAGKGSKAKPDGEVEDKKKTPEATLKQARRLRKLGFKVRNGKRWRKPSYKEIPSLLTKPQAGVIIRSMEGNPPKKSWTVDVPARPFLGMSDEEFNKALARQLQAIGFGWNVNAQDIKG